MKNIRTLIAATVIPALATFAAPNFVRADDSDHQEHHDHHVHHEHVKHDQHAKNMENQGKAPAGEERAVTASDRHERHVKHHDHVEHHDHAEHHDRANGD
jgi:hypothetical protein